MNDQIRQLLKHLIRKTKARQAVWHSTRQRQEYVCRLHSGFVLVDRFKRDSGLDVCDFTIQNRDGERILYIVTETMENDGDRGLVEELHRLVVDRVLNISETLDSMISELESSPEIGTKEPPTNFGGDVVF